ncbi:MAG: riboflavin biosynthesis protein RibD [Omnitrophica WOR_2 bacterium GWA2_45_18]|nr:MAG: riboflavin biosynthesis protein RibD [Omnitrophica WOR_2 bacterium GWA2_45_18]
MTDRDYMQRALALALKAKGQTSPNPLVGAVIVRGEKVIAEGWHRRCGADHAEIVALKKAGDRAKGARLFVNLEPCFHYGRTPPCVDEVIRSGIQEVILGMKDPNPLTHGKSVAKLRRAAIPTRVGILRTECEKLNEVFVKYITTGMPFVATKSAQSLDGKIATASGRSQWITSEKSRQYARVIRDEFDAILVGINTVMKDNPGLNPHRKTKKLKKIILDTTLKISLTAKLFEGMDPRDCLIVTTAAASPSKRDALAARGVTVIIAPPKEGRVDIRWAFKELAKREITSILVEGGARVIGSALRENLVDKMYIYTAPKIIGNQRALSSIDGLNGTNVEQSVRLKNLTMKPLDDEWLVTGYVFRDR